MKKISVILAVLGFCAVAQAQVRVKLPARGKTFECKIEQIQNKDSIDKGFRKMGDGTTLRVRCDMTVIESKIGTVGNEERPQVRLRVTFRDISLKTTKGVEYNANEPVIRSIIDKPLELEFNYLNFRDTKHDLLNLNRTVANSLASLSHAGSLIKEILSPDWLPNWFVFWPKDLLVTGESWEISIEKTFGGVNEDDVNFDPTQRSRKTFTIKETTDETATIQVAKRILMEEVDGCRMRGTEDGSVVLSFTTGFLQSTSLITTLSGYVSRQGKNVLVNIVRTTKVTVKEI